MIRAFEDDSVYHAEGSVDPVRDADMVNGELIMHDQIFVEKRIARIETALKKIKDDKQAIELDLMHKLLAHLEEEKPLRLMEFNEDEELLIRSYPLITRKELILAFNVAEDHLGNNKTLLKKPPNSVVKTRLRRCSSAPRWSQRLCCLDSEEEKVEFLEDLGIDEPALGIMTRLCLKALGPDFVFHRR